jgi:cytochrome P450
MQELTKTPERQVPGPDAKPFVGNIPDIKGRDLIRFYYDMWQQYGDMLKVKLGPADVYVVTHPDYIQHVMVKHPEIYSKGFTMEKLRLALGDGIFAAEGEPYPPTAA